MFSTGGPFNNYGLGTFKFHICGGAQFLKCLLRSDLYIYFFKKNTFLLKMKKSAIFNFRFHYIYIKPNLESL